MRRRLYFVLPDVTSASQTANDLLLARIEYRHMHFLGRRDMSLEELHEASYLQKTDVRHALAVGTGIGVIIGMLLGIYLKLTPMEGYTFDIGTLIVCTIAGGLFGAWCSTLVGVSLPNSELKQFQDDIEAGKILLMVDVPVSRVVEIEQLIAKRHPEVVDRGVEPSTPVFP